MTIGLTTGAHHDPDPPPHPQHRRSPGLSQRGHARPHPPVGRFARPPRPIPPLSALDGVATSLPSRTALQRSRRLVRIDYTYPVPAPASCSARPSNSPKVGLTFERRTLAGRAHRTSDQSRRTSTEPAFCTRKPVAEVLLYRALAQRPRWTVRRRGGGAKEFPRHPADASAADPRVPRLILLVVTRLMMCRTPRRHVGTGALGGRRASRRSRRV